MNGKKVLLSILMHFSHEQPAKSFNRVVVQFEYDRHCEERSNLDIYNEIASFLAMTKRQKNSNSTTTFNRLYDFFNLIIFNFN